MMTHAARWRWLMGLVLGTVLGTISLGCGYTEEEMRAKQREIDNLRNQLSAEQAQSQKAQKEIDDARARIEQLKAQLKAAGVDMATLSKNMEEQARALEEYKKRAAELEKIKRRFELLRAKLQGLTKFGLNVTVRNNRLVIQLPGDVLFDTGRVSLRKKGEEILVQVASVIRGDSDLSKRQFQVAGHTDNEPLRAGIFKDNWGLSVMRAREVLAFLIKPTADSGGGLSAGNWSASGYGSLDPVAPNDTAEGRQKNRRCELIVVPNVEEMLDLKTLIR
jgi:chemotaxis protein MotB